MGATIMMYVLPMLLGQTYHLGKEKPGVVIYPANIANEAVKIQRHFTDSQYRMVENVSQMKDFLDVTGKLSLKIKAGMLDVSGEGKYLKESSIKTNGLEILVKLHFETMTLTIPSSKRPNPDFLTIPRNHIGTHYCRSITYGGDLVASIRISGSDKSDLEHIKGAINAGLKTKGGSFEGDIRGKLEMLKKNAVDSSSMEIKYYASVPIHGVSYSMDGLLKLVDDFPNHVKKVNEGLGNPLRMELYPLSSLSESFPEYVENRGLSDELEDLDNQFDDLRETRRSLADWIVHLPPTLSKSVQKAISDFSGQINDVYAVYIKTISELDTSQGASTESVKQAFKAYRGGDYMLPHKYARKFRQLQKKTYNEDPDLKPKAGGAHYIRWGHNECSSPDSEISFSGMAVASRTVSSSSENGHNGRSSDYICSPLTPNLMNLELVFKGYEQKAEDSTSTLNPLKYKGSTDRHKHMKDKNIACCHCRVNSRKVAMIKMATKSCPESWTKEYEGHMMGPGTQNGVSGQFICVDDNMKEPSGKIGINDSEQAHGIAESFVRCGSLACEPYKESRIIPCVVCSI